MRIPEDKLKNFISKIAATRPDEIGCEDCYEQLSLFADMLRDGKDPAKVMPLMQHHLEMCNICGEEFEALVQALEAAAVD
jgi:hypothetical protein